MRGAAPDGASTLQRRRWLSVAPPSTPGAAAAPSSREFHAAADAFLDRLEVSLEQALEAVAPDLEIVLAVRGRDCP